MLWCPPVCFPEDVELYVFCMYRTFMPVKYIVFRAGWLEGLLLCFLQEAVYLSSHLQSSASSWLIYAQNWGQAFAGIYSIVELLKIMPFSSLFILMPLSQSKGTDAYMMTIPRQTTFTWLTLILLLGSHSKYWSIILRALLSCSWEWRFLILPVSVHLSESVY